MFSDSPLYIAYIDPGTGSFVAQVIAASAIGVLVAVKSFWVNIKLFFLNIFQKKQTPQQENNKEEKTD